VVLGILGPLGLVGHVGNMDRPAAGFESRTDAVELNPKVDMGAFKQSVAFMLL
jgi:hypothetical protein